MQIDNEACSLKVSLGSREMELKTNRHSPGCSIAYVFYPECHCELKPVPTKHRLLEFDLFGSPLPLATELKAFEEDGKLALEAVSGTFQPLAKLRPDALLIPLDHQYNQGNLSLKG
jgi:hypothetical protein